MLSDAGIEGVGRQAVFAFEKSKPACRDNDVSILALEADRAIAVFNLDPIGQGDLKPDSPTMTSALMPSHFITHKTPVDFD